MQSKPDISIIIPSYNREALIAQTLASIKKQEFKNWECIIVDDSSTDTTLDIVQEFVAEDSRFKLLERPDSLSKGANSCRNYGFKYAQGDYIIWFDSDDIMLPDDLAVRFANSQNMDVVVTLATVTDQDLKPVRDFRLENTFDLYRQYAYTKTEMITNSVLFRRSFLEEKELFDPKIVRGQEADFFMRIFRYVPNNRFTVLKNIGFLYRQHEGTKSAQALRYNSEFNRSQVYIYSSNLAYAQEQQDAQLAKYMYKQLIPLLEAAAINRDHINLKKGLANLQQYLGRKNKTALLEIRGVFWLFYVLKRTSYRLARKLVKKELEFI